MTQPKRLGIIVSMMTTQTPYTDQIRQTLARLGHIGVNPRHVEGYMRVEHPTLDGLSPRQFSAEVKFAVECAVADGPENAESVAESFGL